MEIKPKLDPYTFSDQFNNLNQKEKLDKAAKDFEAYFIKEILKEAMKPFEDNESFQESTYKDMFYSNIAQVLADSGGFGLAKMIEDAVKKQIEEQNSQKSSEVKRSNETGT